MKGIHIKHISLFFLVFFVTLTAFSQTTNFYRTSEKEQKKEKKKKSHHVKIPKSTEISILNAQSRPDRPGGSPVPPVLQSRRIYLSEGKTGIDISHYQGRINWEEVARDPQVTFVIMKATESSDFVDNTYQYNIREARRHGLKVGSYHFYRAHVDPELQFRNMMRNIDPRQQDILPVIDVELTNGVSHDLFVNRLERLCDMVTKAYGAHPIIYTGKNFFAKYFNNLRWRHYKFWIAAYTSKQPELAGGQDYIMWQFTDKSRVQGIRGGVDMSRFVFGHTIDDILYRR
ncbi:MAG: glycosyl hydrolase family 25 [Bacteroidaceae bacterium]|nr:glycosyl hydrolase family 25 [Bacteroidaceae bacterium]